MSSKDYPPVLILAGGLATRLAGLNLGIPKALVPFSGRAFIEWKIESLRLQGLNRFILCLGHGSEAICEHLGQAGILEQVEIVHDTQPNGGTGRAVRDAFPTNISEVFVTYGDNLTFCDPARLVSESLTHSASALAIEESNRPDLPNGNVKFLRDSLVRYSSASTEAMPFVDHGILLLRHEDLMLATKTLGPGGSAKLESVLGHISAGERLVGVKTDRRYLEFGNEASYMQAQRDFSSYYEKYVHH